STATRIRVRRACAPPGGGFPATTVFFTSCTGSNPAAVGEGHRWLEPAHAGNRARWSGRLSTRGPPGWPQPAAPILGRAGFLPHIVLPCGRVRVFHGTGGEAARLR